MNWREHSIIGLILSLPFITSPNQIFLALAGSLYPDLDHEVKEEITLRGLMIAIGILIISLAFYFLKSNLFNLNLLISGILILFIYILPYFSDHRGLTHTIWSLIFISLIFSYIIYQLSFISPLSSLLALAMVSSDNILAKLLIPSLFLSIFLSFFLHHNTLNYIDYFIPFFIGYLSHIAADSLTPAGVKAFYPIKYKLKKVEGYLVFLIIILIAVIKWMKVI
ncbi:metal-dependent hydrolase [Methanocaldococcus sp.]